MTVRPIGFEFVTEGQNVTSADQPRYRYHWRVVAHREAQNRPGATVYVVEELICVKRERIDTACQDVRATSNAA